MIYSLFYRHYSFCSVFWVSNYLSINTLVLYQYYSWSHVLKTWFLKLKREVSRTEKRLKTAIMFSGHRWPSREQRNGFVKERNKQVSDRLHVFEGFILPLNPLRLQFMFGLYFTPSLQSLFWILHPACVLLSVCSLHFTLRLHFTPGLQTAVPGGGGTRCIWAI